ncbi:MAG: NmrA family NAD(P)-binding protein [Ignavibacteriota bacterium]|nr:NmrA family NAD(P)-binding protein [Ignavibacterium album]MCZ2268677.1 NmrA family NAD(P)-binding protein [Ignavibacteriales bacterium]QKK00596.1 MAG: NmrA family NAD(P)-binding protein [Ignavibacteriota bacterium]HOJ08186.1 NmrA family NAD(P)-binding protein [Ignavibacteriaceae bacterium]
MNNQIITVIGSTGNIGGELTNILSNSGVSVRAVMRNINRVRELSGVVWMRADVNDKRLLESVLAGADKLFLLTGNRAGFGEMQIEIIKAAERLSIKHVVKLSALGASPRTKSGLAMEHWEAEQALENSKMSWTILRPHAFMQNWLGEETKTVREEGVIYSAIGEGKVPFVDTRDIAAVAAESLLHPEKHSGKRYVLTGGEAIGFQNLADALSKATGKSIVYKSLSMEEMRLRMEKQGMPEKSIDSLLALMAYQKAGGATERVSEDVRHVLGRAPKTVLEFANDYRGFFT